MNPNGVFMYSRKNGDITSPVYKKIKKNKFLTVIRSISIDSTDKNIENYKSIFEKAIGFNENSTMPPKKILRAAHKISTATNSSLEITSIFKPLNIRCYTPLFTLQRSTLKRSRPHAYSLLGRKVEEIMKLYSKPTKSDASTCT